jgi:V8-like Glu-specific endopeptidase
MTRQRYHSMAKATAALGLAVAGSGMVAASALAGSQSIISHSSAGSAAKVQQTKRYWTPQRMRAATPLSVNTTPGEIAQAAGRPAAASSHGPAVTVPPTAGPSAPSSGSGAVARKAQLVPDPTKYPYRTQGKLFFRSGGGAYVCSATVVNTPSKRVIFSARHCAVEGGVWSTHVEFVPGYHNGARPYGKFVATKLYSINGWINSENSSYDISAAVLGGTRKVAAVVGSRGIKFNLPRQQQFASYGYPAASPFDGEKLWSCPSPFRGLDRFTSNPKTQWITCNMTGGSSGGGWIVRGAYLNSVNSYGYVGLSNRMYGPYFGAAAANLYNAVKSQAP